MTTLKEENATKQAQAERGVARRLYLLSLWTPLLILGSPCLGPVFLILFLSGLTSSHPFARWHAKQWALLTFAACSLFIMGIVSSNSICMTLLVSVGGWYLGNVIGLQQTYRGDCWLWRWRVPSAELPRPWAAAQDAPPAPTVSKPLTAPGETVAPVSQVPADPHAAFAQGRSLVLKGQQTKAVTFFLTAFRHGPSHLRRRAINELEKLGEVEMF